MIGFLAFFVMPIIGWGYARVIQREAPVAFHAIMGGHASPHFTVKMGLICMMLVIAGTYVFSRYRSKAVRWAATAGLGVLYVISWMHPPLKWLGESKVVWHGACTLALGGLGAFMWRSRFDTEARRWRWLMLTAGLAAFFAFTLGGFVRERSRSPDTVYGEIVKPEVTQAEADRFLTYAKCLQCHHKTMKEFERAEVADWPAVLVDDDHAGMALTEEETAGVLRHLEEQY